MLFLIAHGIYDQSIDLSVHSFPPAVSVYLLTMAHGVSWKAKVTGEDFLEEGALWCMCL